MASPISNSKMMELIHGKLICPVCLKIYTDPRILSCGHSFCNGCIKDTSQLDQALKWPCPVCETEVSIDTQDLRLNKNFTDLCQCYKEFCNGGGQHYDIDTVSVGDLNDGDTDDEKDPTIQTVREIHHALKKRLDSVKDEIFIRSDFVMEYLGHVKKAEEVVKDKATAMNQEISKFIDNLKLSYLHQIKGKREKLEMSLAKMHHVRDNVGRLSLEMETKLRLKNVEDRDEKLMSLAEQTRQLENEWRKCDKNHQVGTDYQVHSGDNAMDDIKSLVQKCYRFMDVDVTPCKLDISAGCLSLEDKKHPVLIRDVPVYFLGLWKGGSASRVVHCGIHLDFVFIRDVEEHSSNNNNNTQVDRIRFLNIRYGNCRTLDYSPYEKHHIASVSVSELVTETYIAIGWKLNYVGDRQDTEGGRRWEALSKSGSLFNSAAVSAAPFSFGASPSASFSFGASPFAGPSFGASPSLAKPIHSEQPTTMFGSQSLPPSVSSATQNQSPLDAEPSSCLVGVFAVNSKELYSKGNTDFLLKDYFLFCLNDSRQPSIKGDTLCYVTTENTLVFYSVSERRCIRAISMRTEIILTHLGSTGGNVVCYALDNERSLFSWPVYNEGGESKVTFDTSNHKGIKDLASDENGNLWVLMPQQVVCFSSDGVPRYVLDTNVPWLTNIEKLGIKDGKLILIRDINKEYHSLYIPMDKINLSNVSK